MHIVAVAPAAPLAAASVMTNIWEWDKRQTATGTQILTAQMMMDDFFIYSKYLVPVEIESKENLRWA